MLPDDELQALAADIKANGLLSPVIIAAVDAEWMLVDGRNRRAACRLAKVTPRFEIITSDPVAYVLSANIHRRHMSKGAMAMALAKVWFVSNQTVRDAEKETGIDHSRIAKASTVLQHAPTLVNLVIRAEMGLDAAYKTATERKKAKEWRDAGLRKATSSAATSAAGTCCAASGRWRWR